MKISAYKIQRVSGTQQYVEVSFLFILFTITIFSACRSPVDKKINNPTTLYPLPISVPLNLDSGYKISPIKGDSIKPVKNAAGEILKTGVDLPAIGRILDSGNGPKFRRILYQRKLLAYPENIKRLSQTSPDIIAIEESDLSKFNAGNDTSTFVLRDSAGKTIPTGIAIPAKGREVSCAFPEPKAALPLSQSSSSVFNIKLLDAYHGLPTSDVNAVIEDRFGNLWIASMEGLSSYDGKQILHFTTKQGLLQDRVFYLLSDSKGNIWIDYANGTVTKYDGSRFTHYSSGQQRGTIFLGSNSMIEDSAGNIWFRTMISGVSRFDGNHFTHYTIREGLSPGAITCLMEDSKKQIWMGTSNKGAIRFNGQTFAYLTKKNGLNHDGINGIIEDRKGNLWFATDSGVARYDRKTITRYTEKNGLSSNYISSIQEDSEGNLWFGTALNGVCRFDGSTFTRISEAEGLVNNSIFAIMEDRNKNIWFSTPKGLSSYAAKNFNRQAGQKGPLNFNINQISEDRKGNLWFAGAGLVRFDGKEYVQFLLDSGKSKTHISSLLEDRDGRIWISSNRGLLRLEGNILTQFNAGSSFITSQIRFIFEDSKGNFWISTVNQGVIKLEGSKIIQYTEKEGLPNKNILSIGEDKNGNIWLGSRSFVTRFNGSGFVHYSGREGLVLDYINKIKQDKQGRLWFGGAGGVNIFDGKSFLHLSEREGLMGKYAHSILFDKKGNAWVLTEKGLSSISETYKASDSQGQTNTPRIIHYSKRSGLISSIAHNCIDSRNRMWLANLNDPGVTMFNLKEYTSDESPPEVHLKSIIIHGHFTDFRNPGNELRANLNFGTIPPFCNYPLDLKLPYNLSHLVFYFHADKQVSDENTKYSSMVDGLFNEWTTPSSEAKAEYMFIPPGTYTLRVAAIGRDQVWGKPFEFQFTILPPWWLTWWAYLTYAIALLLAIAGLVQWRLKTTRIEKLRLEKKVDQRTNELKEAKEEVELSLAELKATQSQLVQREKMASLGELTAGIAHEIQNPLNFVNNFSEVNRELLAEMKDELEKGNIDEAKTITKDVIENEGKINQHGKRADAIVKGMLQHSRSSTGIKEPTDINTLADEYLHLTYHGLRAKDKSFNATFKTDFDNTIGPISIIPQDIGRVLLNLINNAFYAVSEKKKTAGEDYEPIVTVSTRKHPPPGGRGAWTVEISVSDNGIGIPDHIKDKIFQPFFTTKPTGQGTGLGLSLSYDIIKAHGGDLRVETKEGEGSEFIIILPNV